MDYFVDEDFGSAASGRNNLRYARFRLGKYLVGRQTEELPIGTEAVVVRIATGLICLKKGEKPQRIVKEPGKQLPELAELNGTDESSSDIGLNGRRLPPWSECSDVLMVRRDTDEALIFSTHSATGRYAVANLDRAVIRQGRIAGKPMRPIVRLEVGIYEGAASECDVPKFTIVEWLPAEEVPAIAYSPESVEVEIPRLAAMPDELSALKDRLDEKLASRRGDPPAELPQPRRRRKPDLGEELNDKIPY